MAYDMKREHTRQALGERLVRNDVIYCVSALVSTLAAREWDGSDGIDADDLATLSYRQPTDDDYADQAPERVTVLQVESEGDKWEWMGPNSDEVYTDDGGEYFDTALEAYQSAYETNGWDAPDGAEVYEHWIVSSWLAARLREAGETVVDDVAGLTIWGRCTTGQAISMDGVIQRIAVAAYGEPETDSPVWPCPYCDANETDGHSENCEMNG